MNTYMSTSYLIGLLYQVGLRLCSAKRLKETRFAGSMTETDL